MVKKISCFISNFNSELFFFFSLAKNLSTSLFLSHNCLLLCWFPIVFLFFSVVVCSFLIKESLWDFPGGPVVKSLPCNAGDMSSIPGQGTKTPHAQEQLSPYAATAEPVQHK